MKGEATSMKFKQRTCAIGVGVLLAAAAVTEASDALLNKLVEKGYLTQREANDVRAEMEAEDATTVQTYNKSKVSSWVDALTWSGDLRLRGEYFDFEENPATGAKLQGDRLRFRYRLRLGVEAQIPEWATLNLRLASGDGDPVSVNQTFTDTFRKKPINIDVASITIQPPGQDYVKVIGGKMDIP